MAGNESWWDWLKNLPQRAEDAVASTAQRAAGSAAQTVPALRVARDVAKATAATPRQNQPKTLAQAAATGVENLPSSVVHEAAAAIHPLLPWNWWETAKNVYGLGKGALAKTGIVNDPQAAETINAIGRYYKNKYGTEAGFKEALANNPASFLSDVGAVASLPFGGELLEAKAPGVVSKAVEAARLATNPVDLAARGVGAVARGTRAAKLGMAGGLGDVTAPSEAVTQAVEKATNGRVGATDLQSNPAFTSTVLNTMNAKGITPEAAKEAILTYHGSPTPRSRITGKPADITARGESALAAKEGQQAVATSAGTNPPSPTDLGDALAQAHNDSFNNFTHQFRNLEQGPEHFAPVAGEVIRKSVDQALQDQNLADFMEFPTARKGFAPEARQFVIDRLHSLAQNDSLSAANLMDMRSELNALQQKASSAKDIQAIGAMRSGLDDGLLKASAGVKNAAGDEVQPSLMVRGDPDTFVPRLQSALNAFKSYQDTFNTPGPVKSAIRQLKLEKDGPTGLFLAGATPDNAAAAQDTLLKSVLTNQGTVKPSGHAAYETLSSTLGDQGQPALHNAIKNTVAQVSDDAVMKMTPQNIQDFLRSPVAQDIYANVPDEASHLNLGAEARRILDTKPAFDTDQASLLQNLVSPITQRGTQALKGAAIGSLFGNPAVGATAASILDTAQSGKAARRMIAAERAGAEPQFPIVSSLENKAAGVSKAARPLGMTAPARHTDEEQAPESDPWAAVVPVTGATPAPDNKTSGAQDDPWADVVPVTGATPMADTNRPQRASGGRIDDMESLVGKLMRGAQNAKRDIDSGTEKLLNHSDSTIMSALHTAKQGI